MGTQLELFNFSYEGNQNFRSIEIDGELWFYASDVAKILEYRDASNLLRNLDEEEKGTHFVSTLGGMQEISIINESGLYSAIFKSKKEQAKKFKKWVTSEVLPQIRQKGSGEMLIEYSDFVFHDSDKISEEESFAFPRKDSISSEPIPIVMPEPQNKEKIKFY